MILIKFGGSVITDKSKPLAASRKKIAGMARAVSRTGEPAIIVHGGGSFGHYWSVKYDMHTAERNYDTRGVATVKNSMVQLNLTVLEETLRAGLRPYAVAPAGFMAGPKPVRARAAELGRIAASSDMTPVTYGDAMWYGSSVDGGAGDKDDYRTYILSGDRIMAHLARITRPRLCVFALGEDGLYSDMESRRLIRHVPFSTAPARAGKTTGPNPKHGGASGAPGVMDVTGGMTRKVREAGIITREGIPVAFVNGSHPKRIRDAVASDGPGFKGTFFEPGGRNGGVIKKRKIRSGQGP